MSDLKPALLLPTEPRMSLSKLAQDAVDEASQASGPQEQDCCRGCGGSGTVRGMTSHLGPDDYEFDAECEACHGTGSADIRDAVNALGYWNHKTDIARILVERAAVLRIIEARAALRVSAPPKDPEKAVAPHAAGIAKGDRFYRTADDLSAASADGVRLDWLSEYEARIGWNREGDACRVWRREDEGDWEPVCGWATFFDNHRAAIDAAMLAVGRTPPQALDSQTERDSLTECPPTAAPVVEAPMVELSRVCGVDCHPGDANCNGYCRDARIPAPATYMAPQPIPYLKDGETPLQCIERHRREHDGLLELLAKAREETATLRATTSTRKGAEGQAVASHAEEVHAGGVAPADGSYWASWHNSEWRVTDFHKGYVFADTTRWVGPLTPPSAQPKETDHAA